MRFSITTTAVLTLLGCIHASALGQVRSAPQGNSLPEASPPPQVATGPSALTPDAPPAPPTPQQHQQFAAQLDLSAFRRLAVFEGGRAKIIDTLAREQLTRIYGKPRWTDPATGVTYDPVFTLLDLLFEPSYYYDKPLIYVEVLDLRRQLVSHLPPAEQETWLKRGRLAPRMLVTPHTAQVLGAMTGNLTLDKALRQLRLAVYSFDQIGASFYLISPGPGSDQWAHVLDPMDAPSRADAGPAPVRPARDAAAPATDAIASIQQRFLQLRDVWRAADAVRVNVLLAALVDDLPRLNPASYPAPWVRQAEYLYNITDKFTVGHWAYFGALILLLIAFGTQRLWLIRSGLILFAAGFLAHTAGVAVRGVLAGRWPIHNQFESFMAITWFATLVGAALMLARRQWLFGAAAAAMAGCALLLANTVPIPSHDVGQVAGILATSRILYFHVNMVLFSYGLIALGFFVSAFYLAAHYLHGRPAERFAAAGPGATGLSTHANPTRPPAATPARVALLHDLDRAQMVVLQLAFWVLGAGILLGAYWADHAWGRWWAWDPKETWALLTWIIYLIVIHLRFAVRNRGLVTAWLSVVGFLVMLWTYWGVNLLLAGLHSYA